MNVVFVASAVIGISIILGTLLAIVFYGFSKAVTGQQQAQEQEIRQYNATLTMGYQIPVKADYETQLVSARKLAAKRAASMPRGTNVRIGQGTTEGQETAFEGINKDPVSAVRIARFHSWEGLRTGSVSVATGTTVAPSTAEAVAPVKSAADLIPGKDYPYIEITDGMSPAEKRKARIANAKAKSAAVKEIKAAGAEVAPAVIAETTPMAKGETSALVQPVSASAVHEPVAGVDYTVIEIIDDMEPADIRKARIANAKAKSAAMKAFKAAGGSAPTTAVDTPAPPVPAALAPPVAEEAQVTVVPADIPSPEYIEIMDDMDPADVRKARIANSKARSAYNKALKAAGIDPASVSQ